MNKIFEQIVHKYGLQGLDDSPFFKNLAKFINKTAKQYNHQKIHIDKPSYLLPMLCILAITVTIIKIMQTFTLMITILIIGYLNFKEIGVNSQHKTNNNFGQNKTRILQGWLVTAFLFMSDSLIYIDIAQPFIRIVLLYLIWMDDCKYLGIILDQYYGDDCAVQAAKDNDSNISKFTGAARQEYEQLFMKYK